MRTLSRRTIAGLILGFVSAAMIAPSTSGAERTAAAPDFSGLWARMSFGFERPKSGPGPILRLTRITKGLGDAVGDYTNPILKPEAAEAVKKKGEIFLSGVGFPTPSNQCFPYPTPYIFAINQELQFVQLKDEVLILHMFDNQTRHVRMNRAHPARVIPSWYGDSVGRYEGDTLVVDTVGIKVTPIATVDRYGTPYSAALHVVERYRLIDGDAAKQAAEQGERENGLVPGDSGTGDGIGVDLGYKGKGLQVEFTVEDPGVFTMPWSASVTYRRAAGDWVERICAENTHVYYSNDTAVPTAAKPDF